MARGEERKQQRSGTKFEHGITNTIFINETQVNLQCYIEMDTAQKMKFSIKDFFRKYDQTFNGKFIFVQLQRFNGLRTVEHRFS